MLLGEKDREALTKVFAKYIVQRLVQVYTSALAAKGATELSPAAAMQPAPADHHPPLNPDEVEEGAVSSITKGSDFQSVSNPLFEATNIGGFHREA